MQPVMHALCRHVPKKGLQTDTNFLRVVTCSWSFAQEALSLCSAVKRACPKTKMICCQAVIRLLMSEKSKSPLRMCIHKDKVRFCVSGLMVGERKYFGQASVATDLSMTRLDAASICCLEHSNLARTQPREFADWFASMAVENNLDREGGSPLTMMAVLAYWDNQN